MAMYQSGLDATFDSVPPSPPPGLEQQWQALPSSFLTWKEVMLVTQPVCRKRLQGGVSLLKSFEALSFYTISLDV